MEEYIGYLFLAIILGIVTGIIGEWIAKKKGRRRREGFWLGFLLSFIGLIIECVLPKISQPSPVPRLSVIDGRVFDASVGDGRPRIKCPFCAEMILAEAKVCRYCQRDLLLGEVEQGPSSHCSPPAAHVHEAGAQASTSTQQSPAKEHSSLFAASSSEANSRQPEQIAPAQTAQVVQTPVQPEEVVQAPAQPEEVVQASGQPEQVAQAPAPLTCPSCARRISANDRFCFFCGKKLGV
jgi:uncharacterized membrane protein YeaQ/YmgE (transglycosylase-associated protein family)